MWPLLLAFLSLCLSANCALLNKTIDDTFPGDDTVTLTYFPPQGAWLAGSGCRGCHGAASPDPSQAYSGTWHDDTQDSNIDKVQSYVEISFIGTAVTVYCIIANKLPPNVGTKADYSFFLDGANTNFEYHHTTDSTDVQFYYNVPVYSTSGLPSGKHTLRVVPNGGAGVQGSTLLLFDYAVVGVDSPVSAVQGNLASTQGGQPLAAATSPTPGIPPTTGQAEVPIATTSSLGLSGASKVRVLSTFATDSSSSLAPTSSNPAEVVGETSHTNTAALTAGVICGLLVLVASLVGVFFFIRRRKQRKLADATADLIPPPRNDHVARWVAQQNPFIHPLESRNTYDPPQMDNISDIESLAHQPTVKAAPSEATSGSGGTSTIIRQLEREIADLRLQQQELMRTKYASAYTAYTQ